MKKLFSLLIFSIFLVLSISISNVNAQNQYGNNIYGQSGEAKITHAGVWGTEWTFANSQTDTTENFRYDPRQDSMIFAYTAADTSCVYFKILYGDFKKSNILSSTTVDSAVSKPTSGGVYKIINWSSLVKAAGGAFFPYFRIVLQFQAANNSTKSAKYQLLYYRYNKPISSPR